MRAATRWTLIGAATLAWLALGFDSAVAQQGPWEPTTAEAGLAIEMRNLLNREREREGLTPLLPNPNLDRLAYQHAYEMAARGSVTHHSHLFGVSTKTRVRLAFPDVYRFAENVAVNRTPLALHLALLDSPGHRLNRMDPDFTHAGFGVARAGEYQLFVTELFVRVNDEEPLARVDRLYTTLPPEELPDDEPSYGEVLDETVRVGRPADDNPEYWTQRGLDAYDEAEFAAAVKLFEQALEIDPDYQFARFDLARAHLRNGSYDAALSVLDDYLAHAPDDLDAWSTRGTAALLAQRYELARDAFERVLQGRSRDPGSWYNFGLAQEMLGDAASAERAYRQALHLDPGLSEATVALSRVQR